MYGSIWSWYTLTQYCITHMICQCARDITRVADPSSLLSQNEQDRVDWKRLLLLAHLDLEIIICDKVLASPIKFKDEFILRVRAALVLELVFV